MKNIDKNRMAAAIEITQFSGFDIRLCWDAVLRDILQHEDTEEPRSIPKESFLEITRKLFPKWKGERQKYLTSFIMETLSEGISGSKVKEVFNIFEKLHKVRVLRDKQGKLFTVMQILK